jgi:phenylacetate-CoA ligase
MIDESSGSTGTPYNWVRTVRERLFSHLFVSYFCTYCFGSQQRISINAFSMGAWATGLNMGLALQRNTIVKNTGPDLQKRA